MIPPGIWLIILVALAFDFINGFHDAANSIATVVSTRVLSPHTAVAWSAFFNFVAFMVFAPTRRRPSARAWWIPPRHTGGDPGRIGAII
jgi:PiT family inorganic phosphate transporter